MYAEYEVREIQDSIQYHINAIKGILKDTKVSGMEFALDSHNNILQVQYTTEEKTGLAFYTLYDVNGSGEFKYHATYQKF